jgi:hypothetical protein
MTRDQLIFELTEYELLYLINNDDKHTITEVTEFFASGGFNSWSNKALEEKYTLFIAEEL